MKPIMMVVALLFVAGCEKADTVGNSKSGDIGFDNICIEGVTYLAYKLRMKWGLMTVKLDKDSKIIPCVNSDK